jgi:hypothetical protein
MWALGAVLASVAQKPTVLYGNGTKVGKFGDAAAYHRLQNVSEVLYDPDQPWRRSSATIRLVSDMAPMEWGTDCADGRVEIWHEGMKDELKYEGELAWGTLCARDFTQENVNVVCNMMGFAYGMSTFAYYGKRPKDMYGTGSGVIWLDEVKCDGSEPYIAKCTHAGWGNVGCTHEWESGVICSDNPLVNAKVDSNKCAEEKTLAERCAATPGCEMESLGPDAGSKHATAASSLLAR